MNMGFCKNICIELVIYEAFVLLKSNKVLKYEFALYFIHLYEVLRSNFACKKYNLCNTIWGTVIITKLSRL